MRPTDTWICDQLLNDGLSDGELDAWWDDLYMAGVCIPMLKEALSKHDPWEFPEGCTSLGPMVNESKDHPS